MPVQLSNAFQQGRHIPKLNSNSGRKPVAKLINEAHKAGTPYKRIAQAAQAEANIKKGSPKVNKYWSTVAKTARAIGHQQRDVGGARATGSGYSLKYPKEEVKRISRIGRQATLTEKG